MRTGISIREFARRDGCSDTLVRKALKTGHLKAFEDGTLDPELVGSGWREANRKAANPHANTDANSANPTNNVVRIAAVRAPPKDLPPDEDDIAELSGFLQDLLNGKYASQADAERIKENALAALRVLELQKKSGSLIEMEVAEAVLFDTHRAARDAWMNWPARIGPLLAADLGLEADSVVEAITPYVHQQLTDLGEPEADFSDPEG